MSKIEIDEKGVPVIIVPFQMRHLGRKQTIVLDCGKCVREMTDEPLVRAVILAHQYADMLEHGKFTTVLQLAQSVRLDRSYVARTLNLVNLAPDIIQRIMAGKAPESLTLNKLNSGFPEDWKEQRNTFGMV